MLYEGLKQTGELPIIGVNTYLGDDDTDVLPELMRSTDQEKQNQLEALKSFKELNAKQVEASLESLSEVALRGENIFAELMNTVKTVSLGDISNSLYRIGGKYRRNM